MAENTSPIKHIHSSNLSSTDSDSDSSASSSVASGSPRSSSPMIGWTIKYKTIPKKLESKGAWDGYQTKEEFMSMHLR